MLSARQKAALRSRAPKILLCTIVFDERDLEAEPHPALTPRALRLATTAALMPVEPGGVEIPFVAAMSQWPSLRRSCSPRERQAPVATTQVGITAAAGFPHDAVGPATPASVWARIDVWCPGLALTETIPRLAGPVTAAPYDDRRGGVRLTIEDGDTLRNVEFPPGQQGITAADFPDAPDHVIGQARRQIIFGPFPDAIPCIPISRDFRRWYLCEPPATAAPTRFQIGGVDVPRRDHPVVTVGRLGTDPRRTFSELVFPTTTANLGLFGTVTAAGGVGLAVDSAPITLLRDIGGYRLSARAERELARVARLFNFSVFLNEGQPVWNLVRDRLLPQTDLMLTMHLNRADTFRLRGEPAVRRHVRLGEGLRAYVPSRTEPSTSEEVYNVIEVGFRRNIVRFAPDGTLTRDAVVIDGAYGGPIGALLHRSERRFSRRQLSIEAADLVDDGVGGVPAGVVALGELTAELSAFPARPATYDAAWDVGLGLTLNAPASLTDSAQDFNMTPVRVVGDELLPTGPRLIFATEPADE